MPETRCFSEMRWYSEIATTAFCESLDLRKILLEKRRANGKSKQKVPLLEPCSAEFISAFAAGINSRHTLQIGCGLSTIALAAAARATSSQLWSVHHEKDKQRIVQYFLKELGLIKYVEFITEDAATFIPQREGVEFVLLSGLPARYIELFDLLKLKKGAIVVADNALDETTNEYIRHVRRQPGVDSSTLPLSRGIEITKIVTWEEFKSGRRWFSLSFISGVMSWVWIRRRKFYGGSDDPINDVEYVARQPGLQGVGASNIPLSSSNLHFTVASEVVATHSSANRPKKLLVQFDQKCVQPTAEGEREDHESSRWQDGSDAHSTVWESDRPESSQQGELRAISSLTIEHEEGCFGRFIEQDNSEGIPAQSSQREPERMQVLTSNSHFFKQASPPSPPSSFDHELSVDSAHGGTQVETFEEQFKSLRSLASQWQLQLAAQGGGFVTDGGSTKSSRGGLPQHMIEELNSYSTASDQSTEWLRGQPSGNPQHDTLPKANDVEDYAAKLHWHLPMNFGKNVASVPSSDASIAEKVAPEPLEPPEAELPNEASTSGVEEGTFEVTFHNESGQTEVTIVGVDQEMLLFDITLAFNETGVSVKRAKIATNDIYVTDVFYVVDGDTKAPLVESRFKVVRRCILERIAQRRQLLQDQ